MGSNEQDFVLAILSTLQPQNPMPPETFQLVLKALEIAGYGILPLGALRQAADALNKLTI